MYDLVIKNGTIVDGDLTKRYIGNIGLMGNKIIDIHENEMAGREEIDATGLIVSPGFIDLHSHGDFLPFLEDDYKLSRIRQGITTEVVGQCGIGPIPYNLDTMNEYRIYTQPILGDIRSEWNFTDLNSLDKLMNGKRPHNMAYLVGLSALRSYVAGLGFKGLNTKEMERMFSLYQDQLEQGAFGLSLGLSYLPGVFASREELLGLAKITKENDGIIMAHIRSHGHDMVESIEEFINIGRETGAKIHISHCRSYKNKDFGISSGSILETVANGRGSGVDITLDQHPYTTGSTFLNQLLPPEDRVIEKYEDKDYAASIKKMIYDKNIIIPGWDNMSLMVGFENIFIPVFGMSIHEMAEGEGVDDFTMLIDVLRRKKGKVAMVVKEMFDFDEIDHLLQDEQTFIGSDGLPSGRPHPRLYGAFPKIISDHVRSVGNISLEEAIYKMTGGHIIGLKNRGVIKKGGIGDLVLFNYDKISHDETYSGENIPPRGIEKVIIDGKLVYNEGNLIDYCGRLLKRGTIDD